MYRVIKEVRWEAAHRLLNYKGKCANIHGHSYRAIFTFESNKLDENGMVIDFTILKKALQTWLDEYWDHSLILNKLDPLIDSIKDLRNSVDTKIYLFDGNPTAENMARALFSIANNIFKPNVYFVSVEVFEGRKSSAVYIIR